VSLHNNLSLFYLLLYKRSDQNSGVDITEEEEKNVLFFVRQIGKTTTCINGSSENSLFYIFLIAACSTLDPKYIPVSLW